MARRKEIGVLYSGGLDSAALIGHLLRNGYDVWPIHVRCGLRWENQERYWAQKFLTAISSPRLHKLTSIRLSIENAYARNWSKTGSIPGFDSPDHEVFLPARNLLLIVKALLFLSSKGIYQLALATLGGNPFPDAKPSYFRTLEKLLTRSFRNPIKILTPFRDATKLDIINMNMDSPLHLSLSCINPRGRFHCGRCNKCAERQRAFRQANTPDKTVYRYRRFTPS